MKRRRALLFSITIVLALCAACGLWMHREQRQYALNRRLIAALERGDTKTALELVNAGADPDTRVNTALTPSLKSLCNQLLYHTLPRPNNSRTALMITCGLAGYPTLDGSITQVTVEEDLSLLRAMLAHGADVNARTDQDDTARHIAVIVGGLHTVELLLQHGADVNRQNQSSHTPLMYAVQMKTPFIAHVLLTHGANPNVKTRNGDTALYLAVQSPIAADLLPDLLAHGADPNIRFKDAYTPLEVAQRLERPNLIRLLKRGTK